MIVLNVPYKSQWDDDATATQNDCGPASIAMILNFYNEKLSTNDVFYKSGAGLGYVTFAQMFNSITSYGYRYELITGCSIGKLKEFVDKEIPVIALVHYGELASRQDQKFTGPHFFVVCGYDDNNYIVNDPNYWGNRREEGNKHYYSKDQFETAWTNASIDGNPSNSVIVIYPKTKPVQTSSLSEQDKKDIESMHKLRELNGTWYEAQDILRDLDSLKREKEDKEHQLDEKGKVVSAQAEQLLNLRKELEGALEEADKHKGLADIRKEIADAFEVKLQKAKDKYKLLADGYELLKAEGIQFRKKLTILQNTSYKEADYKTLIHELLTRVVNKTLKKQ